MGELPRSTTIDPSEIEKFSRIADEWWDPNGKFRPLHKFNPVRLKLIRETAIAHFDRQPTAKEPLAGLKVLDIGCGGGLVAEPMARLGAEVTAIDASENNIKTTLAHSQPLDLSINYHACAVEDLIADGIEPVDLVLNLEVVEHVADVDAFLQASASLVKPGGLMIIATINRTFKALALAKIGAEYILRWLPAGTHDHKKFVTPAEIETALAHAQMKICERYGVSFNPLMDQWRLTEDLSGNYLLTATRSAAP